jgi:hypothetical protein
VDRVRFIGDCRIVKRLFHCGTNARIVPHDRFSILPGWFFGIAPSGNKSVCNQRIPKKGGNGMKKENNPNEAQPIPRHSLEVENVAREITILSIGAAILCTIIVMVI